MDILISIIAKIAEYTVKPIGRQLGYIYYYNYYITNLANQVEILNDTRVLVQHRVYEARNNAETIENAVEKWLHKVDDQITESREIVNEGQENKKCCSSVLCLNLVQRHQLSSKAKKMADEVLEIKKQGSFEKLSYKEPLFKFENSTKNSDFMSFESRISTMKEIVDALLKEDVNRIGVYGMGGIGKTMMVEEISRKVKDEKLFGVVTSIMVSQTPNYWRIQGELSDKLGLKFEQETEVGRAILLDQRLKMERSILIVIDGIWNSINLRTIGIPNDHKGCKILFTSRDEHILSEMDVHEKFKLKVLGQEESWNLFIQMGGEINEASHDKHIAMEIVKECAHLPIAIATVAKALRNKPSLIWKDALNQLRNPIAMNIKGMNDKVYGSLKLSYEQLDSKEAKLVFLLCSMFPEDHRIDVEDLHVYAMGMGLLEGIDTLAEGRLRIIKLVDDLTSSSLLQKNEHRDGYVKMHDLVRYVAILIASKDDRICTLSYVQGLNEWREKINLDDYTAAYLCFRDLHNLPQKVILPKAKILILDGRSSSNKLEFSETIFEEMKELKVLKLMGTRISLSPLSLHSFANLQSLYLIYCKLENIDMIGELRKLEILSFRGSDIIEIPNVISQLTKLKLLDLSSYHLKVIPPNMLLGLTKLEELYLEYFDEWEGGNLNAGRKNASLCELKHLSRLSAISICINEEKILPEQLFSRGLKLEKFNISVGRISGQDWNTFRRLSIHMESGSPSYDWIKMLLKRAEELYLGGSFGEKFLCFELDGNGNVFSYLKHLHLDKLTEDNLCGNEGQSLNNQVSFPNLEYMRISNADRLKMVCHKVVIPEYSKFAKLKILEIDSCKNLEKVFPASMMSIFKCLESLSIRRCESLEGIFELVEDANATQQHDGWLPKLSFFELDDLPNLKYVWSEDPLELQIFENLEEFCIEGCPKLKRVYPIKALSQLTQLKIGYGELMEALYLAKSVKAVEMDGFQASKSEITELSDDAPQLLFPELEILELHGCLNNYKWSDLLFKIAQIFPNLGWLGVSEIFVEEIFPNLNSNSLWGLRLYKLPKMKHLWKEFEMNSLFLPNLEDLKIKECRRLNSLFPSSSLSSLTNLTELSIKKCHGLRHLMNPGVATSFVGLQVMDIKGCKMTTTIIASTEVEEEEIVFKELRYLRLEDLPRLTNFHSGKCIIRFPRLKFVSIWECPEMKVFSLGITTTPLLKKADVSLWSGSLQHIIQKDSEEEMVEDINLIIRQAWENIYDFRIQRLFTGQVLLPGLDILKFEAENSLKMICINQLLPDYLVRLKRVEIAFCNNLRKLFPSNVMGILKCLTHIEIESCALLQEIFEVQQPCSKENQESDVLLPQLSSLILRDLPNLKCVWSKDPDELQNFKNMQYLSVHGCPMFKREYPQQLRELSTEYGELMEALEKVKSLKMAQMDQFQSSESEIIELSDDPPQLFPKLEILVLHGCLNNYKWNDLPIEILQIFPNLGWLELRDIFVEEIFPNLNPNSLRGLRVYKLPKLEHLWKELEMNSLFLLNLEYLKIMECSRLNSLFPSSSLSSSPKLTGLSIHKCNGLRHLMNPRVATSFVGLRWMEVKGCKMMTTVIASSEVEEIVFTKLISLILEDLPTLTSFHSGKCIIRFPCLKSVSIRDCPEMKVFSLGITTTPLLKKADVSLSSYSLEHIIQNDSEEEMVEDINLIIRQASDNIYDFGIQHLFTQHEKSVQMEEVDQFESAKDAD